MAIDINTNTATTAAAATSVQETTTGEVKQEKPLKALLGGKSVTVSYDALGGDLAALVEKLKNEQQNAKLSLLFNSLNSINSSLTEAQQNAISDVLDFSEQLDDLDADLTSENAALDQAQAELDALNQQLKDVQEQIETSAENLQDVTALQLQLSTLQVQLAQIADQSSADAVALQVKIDQLQTQIELAKQQGEDHRKLVEKEEELRKEIEEKERVIEETQGRINELKNKISSVQDKISVAVGSIGENTLKTIANELTLLLSPEESDSAVDHEEEEKREAALNPANSISESLYKSDLPQGASKPRGHWNDIHTALNELKNQLLDTIEENIAGIKA